MPKSNTSSARKRRHIRARMKIKGMATKPRLCVFRSLKHIYAQVIDDSSGHTLMSVSTLDPQIRNVVGRETKISDANLVGALVAKLALESNISQVVFDRGGCKYHGRVKALAEAARQAGLEF